MLLLSTDHISVAANGEYLDALDFLNRMQSEGKINEVNVALFTLLYGEDNYKLLLAQGYFSNN